MAHPVQHWVSRKTALKIVGWTVAVAVCLAVFALYTRPDFMLTLANQVWACF